MAAGSRSSSCSCSKALSSRMTCRYLVFRHIMGVATHLHQGTLHCDVDRVAIAQACFAEGQELLEVISNKPWLYPIERVL